MTFWIPFFITSIAGLSTVLGSFVIFFKWNREHINKFITFCLSLSLTIMIGISISELIPESSYAILTEFKLAKGIFFSLLVFLIGVISAYYMNKKLEQSQKNGKDLYRLGVLSMIALMLHNLPEGIVTFLSSYQSITLGFKISLK